MPASMTELKKCSLEVMGEVDVGNEPRACSGSWGVVPATPLNWAARDTLESSAGESLGMRAGRNMAVGRRRGRERVYRTGLG